MGLDGAVRARLLARHSSHRTTGLHSVARGTWVASALPLSHPPVAGCSPFFIVRLQAEQAAARREEFKKVWGGVSSPSLAAAAVQSTALLLTSQKVVS